MKRYCLTLDLKNDAELIGEYEAYHREFRPEIKESITVSGIINMEIYRLDNRLFMIMETDDTFTFEKKKILDEQNEKVQQWEALMWKFQQPIAGSAPGEKWRVMKQIFTLNSD